MYKTKKYIKCHKKLGPRGSIVYTYPPPSRQEFLSAKLIPKLYDDNEKKCATHALREKQQTKSKLATK